MKVELDINDRAFNAINNGTKKVEIRIQTPSSSINYSSLKKEDKITFINSLGNRTECLVLKNNWYKTVRELLEIEGTEFTLSSTNNIEEGIKSIHSFNGYKEYERIN